MGTRAIFSLQLLDLRRSRVKLYILGMVQGVQPNSAALQPDQSETIMIEDA
jgi:hypothetical protein